jgi:hypothetical protein
MSFVRNPVVKVNANVANRKCITFDECVMYLEEDSPRLRKTAAQTLPGG